MQTVYKEKIQLAAGGNQRPFFLKKGGVYHGLVNKEKCQIVPK